MAGDIPVTSGTLERSLLRPMQSLDGEQNSVQEEHASNRTPVSQTSSSFAIETAATYIASLWRPTTSTPPKVAIVTTTPQIIATQQIEIPVSQQQSFSHISSIGTRIHHAIQPQPQYPSMVHPHTTMAGLPHVLLFLQQLPIFNQLV
ncbi:unnamed protein product [Lactuca saligna]|uniref:Uncharacterized protein n=1 Tax=Lactuca saligna TaxID=75948 RepID=A0AA35ZSY8_LACSI|nr:unnamed protein product [Lactuca saligna]